MDDIWEFISYKLSEPLGQNRILGIGVGAPGFVNERTGKVYEAVNIGWKNLPLAKTLQEKAGIPVFVENDANIAALGEYWEGHGNQVENLIIITLGTGVGGGIISDGEILHGENGTAGEIGHIIVNPNGPLCNCGRNGCLDTIALQRVSSVMRWTKYIGIKRVY